MMVDPVNENICFLSEGKAKGTCIPCQANTITL